MNAHRACWLLLTASLLGSAAQAAVDVHLSVAMHTEGGPGAQKVPPDKRYEIVATLSDTWMIVRNGTHTSFFDFARRGHTEIDEATHTRVDFSLFDVAGFRVMEFANRQNLAKAMSVAKITPVQFDLIETEHILSIQDKPASPLHVATDGNDTVFLNGTKTLARESMKTTPVPPAQARMFAQLIRYIWGGHPQILAALAQSNGIPATLTLTTVEVGTTTVTLEVASVQPSGTAPIDIAAIPLQSVSPAQMPINQILARGAAFTDANIAAARQRARDLVAADFKDNRPFDAYLGIIEWTLTTGEAPPAMDAPQKAAVNTDPSVIALNTALAPHSKAAMQQAIDQLEALRPHTQARGYMLDLFVANDRATMGDGKAALDGLVAVLQAHPFVAGAYKDLGDNLLLSSYDAPSAWRCWDIGRHIAHGFANFQAVNQFENSLATQHPEYF